MAAKAATIKITKFSRISSDRQTAAEPIPARGKVTDHLSVSSM
jgi:hypothetical protein